MRPRPSKSSSSPASRTWRARPPTALLDYQAEDPKTKDLFTHLRKDGKWIVRDDVFIKYPRSQGPADDRLRIARPHRRRAGVRHDDGRPLPRAGAADQGGVGRAFARASSSARPRRAIRPTRCSIRNWKQAQDRVKKNNEKKKKNDPLPTMDDIKKPMARRTATCWPR